MGLAVDGRVVVVAHTFTEVSLDQFRVRIVSARRATRRERGAYESGQ
jgi:uncharacterized DUF497 family protein